jgi:hypothetical protein
MWTKKRYGRFIWGIFALLILLLFCNIAGMAQGTTESIDKKSQERQALFESLSTKIDEYQDLLVICDAISKSGNNDTYQDNCKASLESLKIQILDMTTRIENE